MLCCARVSPFILYYLQGGEIVQETITSNVSEDIITLEFQRTDGTLVTELIDFRNVSTCTFIGMYWGRRVGSELGVAEVVNGGSAGDNK